MLEFKIIQELKPNTEILEIIKSYTYITKNGKVKHLLKTNLQFYYLKRKQMRDIFSLGLQKLKLFRKQLKEIFKNWLLFSVLVWKEVRR